MSQVWVVRAGKGAAAADVAFAEGVVGIGWTELAGLPDLSDEGALRDLLASTYPDEQPGTRGQWFGAIRAFLFAMQPGDTVLLPTPSGGIVHVGEVLGPVEERNDLPDSLRFIRPVKWIGSFDRSDALQDLLNSLQGLATVFAINRGGDVDRVRALADGEPDPGPTADGDDIISMPRTHEMIFALANVLAESDHALAPMEAIDLAKSRCSPTAHELSVNPSGNERFTHRLRWWSVGLSKAGWMSKWEGSKQGRWSITDEGRAALARYPDAQDFGKAVRAEYKRARVREKEEALRKRQRERLQRLLLRMPAGMWASFADVVKVVEWKLDEIRPYVWEQRIAGWYRLLESEGTIEIEGAGYEDRAAEQLLLLGEEGLDLSPRAPQSQQLPEAELRLLLRDESADQRAWLVKGSKVSGRDLVSTWLAEGFVSLPGIGFPELANPVERDDVVKAAETSFSGRASDYRRRKVDDYDRFLRLMQTGDLVATTSGGQLFVGSVLGEPEWVDTGNSPSRVRREVAWDLVEGLEYSKLPRPLPERLQSSDDVADFTDVVGLLAGLIDDDPIEPVVPVPAIGVELSLPSEVFAEALHLPQSWLAGVVQLLERRKQIIFYGPPGTGKTFLAQELAEYLTEPSNVQLVQFHPSYSYEDFIQGFRPELSESGQPVFSLRQGPLMKIAEKARDDATTPYFLIIDEINRANLAKVFGELYFLLEYRNRRIDTLYSEGGSDKFSLPDNLFIIGTMNTADRSIALVDAAMRRRFGFEALHPSQPHIEQMLRTWQEQNHPDGLDAAALLAELNSRLDDRDYAIGPSYFMKDWIYTDPDGLAQMWNSDMIPLLEEHHAGDGIDVEDVYGLDRLLRAVDAARNTASDDDLGSGV